MVKLYYTATSCGAANFISAFVAGLSIDTETVDLGTHKTASGVDFYTVNPKGNVPTLVLDDGTILNENAATLQYIADLAPGKVAPLTGTTDRALLQNALSYISGEVHGSIGPLFGSLSAEVREYSLNKVATKLKYLNEVLLKNKKFVIGDSFTVADAYLYIVLSWEPYAKFDTAPFPAVQAYFEGIKALPEVQAAHALIATAPSKSN